MYEKPQLIFPKCECQQWCTLSLIESVMNNGHHVSCPDYKSDMSGAVELLKKLITGIKWWADQEDGIPDELWEAYKQAYWIVNGRFPNEPVEIEKEYHGKSNWSPRP